MKLRSATVGLAATGYEAELDAPNSSPPGVDVADCHPRAAHPYPVILLPGTSYTVAETWQALGPILANAGYCVYGLNYGQTTLTTATGGGGVPGVKLVSIETTHDEVVTPYQSAFLDAPGAVNVTLQDQCPADGTDHLGIAYDAVSLQDVVDALGPDSPGFAPQCGLTLPLMGTP